MPRLTQSTHVKKALPSLRRSGVEVLCAGCDYQKVLTDGEVSTQELDWIGLNSLLLSHSRRNWVTGRLGSPGRKCYCLDSIYSVYSVDNEDVLLEDMSFCQP